MVSPAGEERVTPGPAAPPAPVVAQAADMPPAQPSPPPSPALAPDRGEPLGDLEALQRTLGAGAAEVVEIVERHAIGREQLVLYRWYGARAWRAQQGSAGRLEVALAELDDRVEACERAAGSESVCLVDTISDPHLAWSAAGVEVFAWEVARVRGTSTVIARVRLFELSQAVADAPHKFKVYDIDRDRRSELTVIVPVVVPQHEEGMDQESGELGFILEAADLHVQFFATRQHTTLAQDVGGSETSSETVWLARDTDADGHPDLQVRETTRTRDLGEGEEEPVRVRPTIRQTVCLYEAAADLWRCPEALGQQLVSPAASAPG